MKLNWGTGVVIAMILFMAFILSFVYRSVVGEKYQHELVSEDYYKDELHYQEEIDKVNNANKLEENVRIIRIDEGLLIRFPESMDAADISGTIDLHRPSNKVLDIKIEIGLDGHQQLIADDRLAPGKYKVTVDWTYQGEEYMMKDHLFY